jgi:hypothetical protein
MGYNSVMASWATTTLRSVDIELVLPPRVANADGHMSAAALVSAALDTVTCMKLRFIGDSDPEGANDVRYFEPDFAQALATPLKKLTRFYARNVRFSIDASRNLSRHLHQTRVVFLDGCELAVLALSPFSKLPMLEECTLDLCHTYVPHCNMWTGINASDIIDYCSFATAPHVLRVCVDEDSAPLSAASLSAACQGALVSILLGGSLMWSPQSFPPWFVPAMVTNFGFPQYVSPDWMLAMWR